MHAFIIARMDDSIGSPAASNPNPQVSPQPTQPIKVKHAHKFVYGYLIIIIFAAVVFGVYGWQHNKVKSLNKQVTALNSQVTTLQKQVTLLESMQKKTTTTTATSTSNPYVGWSTYTLVNDKSSLEYPASWKATNTGTNDGQDMVELTAPDGFYLNVQTINLGHPSLDSPTTIVDSVPLSFMGQSGFINYFSVADASSTTGTSFNAELSMTSTSVFNNLFPTKNLSPSGYYNISLGNKTTPISLQNIKNDTNSDYSNTKLIIESIKY